MSEITRDQAIEGWTVIVRKVSSSSSGRVAGAVVRDLLARAGTLQLGSLKSFASSELPKCVGTKNKDTIFFAKPTAEKDCAHCILANISGNVVTCSLGVNRRKGSGIDTSKEAEQLAYTPSTPMLSSTLGRISGHRIG